MRRNISAFADHFVLVLLVLGISISGAMAQANLQGQWSTLPYLMPINPVHVALMHNGTVLVVSGSGNYPADFNANNLRAAVWDPNANTINIQGVAWDMFCNGMVVLPDGRPFVVGGTLQYNPFHGQPKASVFDPASNTFADVQNMAHGRWYPTVTTLGDGRVMTLSGLDESGNTNTAVEIYTVGSGWSPQYSASWTPPLYPRMHLLPNGNVFYSGATTQSRTFNTSTHAWANVATTKSSGTRTYGTSILLPLTPPNYVPQVIIMGGGNPSTATTETIDLSVNPPAWQWGPSMSQPRIEMNAVILPNGKILAVGGSYNDEDTSTASLNADLYDPSTNTFSAAGVNVYARLYHSVALLLPDATVWLAGGNPQRGTYEQHMEIYQPAYLFTTDLNGNVIAATRPSFSGAPSSITYGNSFTVQTANPTNIASVVLVRNGSVTHAFDMDQRLIELSFTRGSSALTATAPPNGNIAPPGYYMLFLLNSSGVPSVASFVQLDSQPDFSIAATPSSQTVVQGNSTTYTVNVVPSGGFTGNVTFSLSGLPQGANASFNPSSVTTSGSSTLTISTLASTAPGSYTLTITATGGTLVHTAKVTLVVSVPSNFAISVAPTSATVNRGSSTTYTTTITGQGGFAGTVNFSVSGLPRRTSASFSPSSVVGSGTSVLSVSANRKAPTGAYPLAITATSGGLVHSVNVTLTIQ